MLHAARLLHAFCSRSRITPAWQARVAWSVLLLSPLSLYARQSPQRSPFERAQHLREVLEARPESQRTPSAYAQVLDAYRAVYHRDPASPKAEASVLAVAQLLGEDGRIFSNEKLLHDAIGQYAFLRVQSPDSRSRFATEIADGEKQARAALNAMHHAEAPRSPSPSRTQRNAVLAAAIDSQQSSPAPAMTPPAIQPQQVRPPSRPPPAMTPPPIQPTQLAQPT